MSGRGSLHAFIDNSGWLLLDKLVRLALALLVGAWVARYLGPSQFGSFAYVLAYLAFFQIVVTLGLDAIVVRDLALHREHAPAILGTVFVLRLVTGIGVWVVAVLGMAWVKGWGSESIVLLMLAGGALVFQAADTIDLWFQSQSQNRLTVAAKLVGYLLSNGLKVVLILVRAPLQAFALVIAIEAMLCALSLSLVYRRWPYEGGWALVISQGRRLLKESWPLLLSGLSITAYIRIDQIMIGEMLGVEALGMYAAILPLSTYWQIIPSTLATSLAPFIARRRQFGEAQYRRSIMLIFRICFYLAVIIAVLTYAASGWLVSLLYGRDYASAAHILDIHVISNVFCFLGIAHGLWLINERRFIVRVIGTVMAGLVAVALNYLLLPRIGLMGACIAAIAAQAVAAFLVNAWLDRTGFWLQVEAITFRKVLRC